MLFAESAWMVLDKFKVGGVNSVGRIAPGRCRKSSLAEGTVAEVVRVTQRERPPDGSTHWTTRTLAKRFGIGRDTVARICRDHNLKPWKVERSRSRIIRILRTNWLMSLVSIWIPGAGGGVEL